MEHMSDISRWCTAWWSNGKICSVHYWDIVCKSHVCACSKTEDI